MGLSFHYKGKLRTAQSLKKMIDEVADIARANKWKHHIFEQEFRDQSFSEGPISDAIYGIGFSPPECEMVLFTFLSNGQLCAFHNLEEARSGKIDLEENCISVKTQFAGSKIHVQLIGILDYFNKKYFENFDLTDEGNYWETKNEQLLEDTFSKYTSLIEGFDSLLENIPIGEEESIEKYLIRIAEMVHKKNNSNSNNG